MPRRVILIAGCVEMIGFLSGPLEYKLRAGTVFLPLYLTHMLTDMFQTDLLTSHSPSYSGCASCCLRPFRLHLNICYLHIFPASQFKPLVSCFLIPLTSPSRNSAYSAFRVEQVCNHFLSSCNHRASPDFLKQAPN